MSALGQWNPASDAWASGFIDGEACFDIVRTGGVRRPDALVPRFAVGLRADDVSVLRDLAGAFGGRISFCPERNGSKPIATWTIAGKAELRAIVDYLDRFPLRSKKARDFAVWREAVLIYVERGASAAELHVLRGALSEGRAFEGPTEVVELRAVAL